MGLIRVVWGSASAPTAMASYDGALADANVHNYNLVQVSSVIPDDAAIEAVGVAPDLGPVGEQLTVVEARQTVVDGRAVAGLGWTTEPSGRGIFYETSGTDSDDVRSDLNQGLDAGQALRDGQFTDRGQKIVTAPSDTGDGEYTTAIVLAVYGESTPLV
ncbi:pyruvoyl-dependent arginine decarboxylase [Halocatena pleomorpha]|uniref:arginine decarboxylase n=1 Tax=Halocatena pleomorpha TaxID=1785090 RepID=A0A3P3RHT3_9EURY|nr:pyruvoyl-dependent arginine decarboxylase [Halocatena pleomorpha]RRJ32330.1 pyruvoyl-dependent arginine decarboxylase [Halocatena pleomorpha]